MLSKYIKELIENNNRIIIPDFGAFMIQDSPEGKQISFNDFLKFNDGLLINQIIKSEKISKNEATDKIKDFIKALEQSFGQKKPYELKDLGFLAKDDSGTIKFDNKKPEAKKGTSPTDVKPTIILDEKAAPAKEVPKVEKPLEKKEEPKKEIPKPAANDRRQPIPNVPKSPQVTKPMTTQKPTKTAQKPESNLKTILIIVAAVIILGGGTWAILTFDLFGKMFNKEAEPVVIEQPAIVIDTTPEVVVDTTPEPVVIEEPQVDPNMKKYYVVAGSFKIKTNAINYNEKLKAEGYASEIVMRRSNGFQIVTYKTLYTWSEALAEWRNMRNTNAETWIFIK
ncbi:MAG: hypothetical protein JEZ09_13545 [Salinivirgaceae bacterium]|nr:hypothetical protein [Salinivirgaceae bacterium]